MIEPLEPRIAPATFLVTSLLDNGADGTLRKEIADANAAPGADTFVFKIPPAQLPGQIILGGTEIPITDTLTISGPGAKVLTISGNGATGYGGALFAGAASLVLTGNQFTENRADFGGALWVGGIGAEPATASLSGNLFQANLAKQRGGAIYGDDNSAFASKADKFMGNVAFTLTGGGVHLANTGGILITGSLFQGNVAESSGGGMVIEGDATLSSVKVLDNIAGDAGRGGGIRITAGTVLISKSLIAGNVADEGGGLSYDLGTTTLAATIVKGNAANVSPNIGTV